MKIEKMDNSEIENLVLRVRQSDQKAFNTLFKVLWEPMYSYACSILMNDSLAQDIVQDIWVDFWQRRQDLEIKFLKSYLYRSIRYKCYNHLRDQKFNKIQLEVANSVSVASEVDQNDDVIELSTRINSVISALPKRCQVIFRLSRINNIDNKEIANKLDISQRSVENQISFALRQLRKELAVAKTLFSFL
ncbi:RNA polymerase sigma-70 factor [Maribacter thermophilus]|uniref:RNA polymerase sigma-70 factor n=1 Tax=Maribacter thermophilus TaxID=1197874 RepID=UPI000640F4D9|nr:RNA polymerase sigma-70 factor [Maribacter thermophilus]